MSRSTCARFADRADRAERRGKSTMFNLLTNLYIADSGSIAYFGQDLAGMRSDKIARLGLIRTFQTARVFAG